MRVLFSVTNLLIGGAQTFLVSLANEMTKKDKVYIYTHVQRDIRDEIISLFSSKIKFLRLPPWLLKTVPFWEWLFRLLKIKGPVTPAMNRVYLKFMVKALRIQVIHSQLFNSDEYIIALFPHSPPPVCITEHGCYNYVVQEGLAQEPVIRAIFKRADGVAYISEINKRNIIQLSSNPSIPFRRMNNGIPVMQPDPVRSARLKASQGIGEDDFVFGMVARGIEEKGWKIAVEAFKQLEPQNHAGIHMVFIGDSPYLRQLQDRVREDGVNNIHFLGHLAAPIRWVECFHIGLLPSYFAGESLPMSVIEYLACGKPVIATDVGSIKDMISHPEGRAGMLFDYDPDFNTNVEQLKTAMAAYLDESGPLREHGALARKCFESFDIKNVAHQYRDLYRSCIRRAKNRDTGNKEISNP